MKSVAKTTPAIGDALSAQPLADRMRPRRLADIAGQAHLLASGKPLRRAVEAGVLHSMILWGPPGSGKTTLARIVAGHLGAHFLSLSAVFSGVKEIRAAVEESRRVRAEQGQPTALVLDELHPFNKLTQEA